MSAKPNTLLTTTDQQCAGAAPFPFKDARDWFGQARFGLFLHWGIYAIDAWHEQQHYRARMSRAAYRAIARRFNPRHFDPDAWIDLAEACGMG